MVDERLMKELSQTKTPQGIMALCKVKASSLNDIKDISDGFAVVSDGIQDPGNMGTLIRATDAAGIRCFITLKGSISPYNPKTIRASAGSVFNISIVLSSMESFIEWKNRHNIPLVITDTRAGKTIYEFTPTGREAFVFGNETQGVSDMIKKEASQSLRIPIYGKAESLNVAMAGSIVLYEMVRRLRLTQSTAFNKNDSIS
jgi:TrmH family RNA methyltransferase